MIKTDLSSYNNSWYNPGAGKVKRAFWFIVNACFFSSWFPLNGVKVFLLRSFGAKVGRGIVIKPRVNIKYPWKLSIGNCVWIGEEVWIDNLDHVTLGENTCLSQGSYILTGNHNFKKASFDLITKPIVIEEGVWIGARAVVCPGVTCASHSVLTVGSVATKDLSSYGLYSGNPAVLIKQRKILV